MTASEVLRAVADRLAAASRGLDNQALRAEQNASSLAFFAQHGARSVEERASLEAEAADLGRASAMAANEAFTAAEVVAGLRMRASRS